MDRKRLSLTRSCLLMRTITVACHWRSEGASLATHPRFSCKNRRDRKDGIPVARCRRGGEEPIDLAEVTDRLHVTPILTEDETLPRPDHAHEPIPLRGQRDRHRSRSATGL